MPSKRQQSVAKDTSVPKSSHAHKTIVSDFVVTPEIQHVVERTSLYLDAGYPIHFRGSAGTGKTALALYLAETLGNRVLFMSGDATFSKDSLLGNYGGSETRSTYDQYISSVKKLHVEAKQVWQNEALATACLEGHTLVYDEFNRSTADANNVFLPILQEGIIPLPESRTPGQLVRVHPNFRAIFTSNSSEYAGVHKTQDALVDRMITIDLDYYDEATEIAIIQHRTRLTAEKTAKIVRCVRDFRASGAFNSLPTMRASLMIADISSKAKLRISVKDQRFTDLCLDILLAKSDIHSRTEGRTEYRTVLMQLIGLHCP